MKFIIFFILLISIIILYFYSDKKVSNLRNQLIALKQQNSTLKLNISNITKKQADYSNITLIPAQITNSSGIIKKTSEIYIGPLDSLPVIYTTDVNMEVKIFDKTQSSGEFWYYVELPKDSSVNSRGWVKEIAFTTFGNSYTNTNIVKRF